MVYDQSLQYVAVVLSEFDRSQSSPSESDALVRTAFNRYYYAAFIRARQLLTVISAVHPSKKKLGHSDYPKHIAGHVKRSLDRGINHARKSKLITDADWLRLNSELKSSTKSISATLTSAYQIRVTADYTPERAVTLRPAPSLEGVTIKEARQWRTTVAIGCSKIEQTWKDCGQGPI